LWQGQYINNKLQTYGQQLDWLTRQLQSPEAIINSRLQQIQLLQHRLQTVINNRRSTLNDRLQTLRLKLSQSDPNVKIQTARQQRVYLKQRLKQAIEHNLSDKRLFTTTVQFTDVVYLPFVAVLLDCFYA